MTSKEKKVQKFISNPKNYKFNEIEKLFDNENYIIQWGKGSHKILTHKKTGKSIVIPVHNSDCKIFYKKRLIDFYLNNLN